MGRAGRSGRMTMLVALAAGAVVGVLAERWLVRRRLAPPPVADENMAALGSIAGELSVIDGPDGVRLAVETYGPSGAPQLVLAHGWMCTGRVWHEQAAGLADRYRVVTYDQPGHGRSTAPRSGDYDLDLLGDTLACVIDQATEPGPVVVMGHSLGGMGLLNAVRRASPALRDRLAGVVLLSTTSSPTLERSALEAGIWVVARLERGLRRLVPWLREPRLLGVTDRLTATTSDLSQLLTRWVAVGRQADPRVATFTLQLVLDSSSDAVPGYLLAIVGVAEDAGLDALAGIPVSVVVGTRDRLTPIAFSRRMAARLGTELVELPGVGHMTLLEAPDVVNAIAQRYLEQARPDAPRAAWYGGGAR